MSEVGLLGDRSVELINGEIIEMPVRVHPRRLSVTRSSRLLLNAFGSDSWVIIQGTLLLPPHGAPDPDFHVFDVAEGTPEKNLPLPILVIEMSDTTYLNDCGPKLRTYAKAGIEDSWILNLPEARLEVYRSPRRLSSASGRWGYSNGKVLSRGEHVSPLSKPKRSFLVDDMLP